MSAETRLSSATKEVVIGFDRPFVIIGERINPTGRKKLAEEMAAGNYETVLADAVAQVEAGAQMLDVNAGIPLADEPAILAEAIQLVQSVTDVPLCIDSSIVAALEAGLARVPGQGARQLRDGRGRPARVGAAARREARRRGRRDHERRVGDLGRPRRAVRGRAHDRLAGGRPRHPEGGRRRRPARHADRRPRRRRPSGLPDRPPAAGGARRELDVRRVQRQLRAPEPPCPERGLPADGDRVRPDVGDHEPAPSRDAPGREGRRRADGQRRPLRDLDRPQRRLRR